ncbi:NHLP leader peptide family RiPP precursor [Paenibacillus sedimenti]|uniref:NHLP leader peptide family natural product n=1 Tax=Paenibacillus sedimenti TaxID=2770274 RepID=A0A926QLB1_9BACL|nr:NHLP leader peptide family RiPP precursor [Paenibacillus sedimenti]MBD0382663.1 NHLP leader peptide family natural product precursor [Paenibacillus sedimenti]
MSVEGIKARIIQKAWEDSTFKEQLLSNPKVALKEAFGIAIPENIVIKSIEETSNEFILVIPAKPEKSLDGVTAPNDTW